MRVTTVMTRTNTIAYNTIVKPHHPFDPLNRLLLFHHSPSYLPYPSRALDSRDNKPQTQLTGIINRSTSGPYDPSVILTVIVFPLPAFRFA